MARQRVELHSFGDNFKKLRLKRGLSQQAFADNFKNATVDTVKNWEQHYNIPEIKTLFEICIYAVNFIIFFDYN